MKKAKVEQILNDNVEFWPPKQIIEFVIDDKFETTGSIEECVADSTTGYALYIDGDEYGYFDSIDDAKEELAKYINKNNQKV